MTEIRWRRSRDAGQVLDLARRRLTARKSRLFATAALRPVVRLWNGFGDFYAEALDANEAFADSAALKRKVAAYHNRVRQEYPRLGAAVREGEAAGYSPVVSAVEMALGRSPIEETSFLNRVRESLTLIDDEDERIAEVLHLADLARCVTGNPYRESHRTAAVTSATVTAIAREVYDAKTFADMPVLGDALEDAGCDDEEMLSHCRAPGLHVRGCWVVDLVLGRR